jgi:hypothetical protein
MMLALAKTYPEYRDSRVAQSLVARPPTRTYGKGYQDVADRVPKIDDTRADLDWAPPVAMDEAAAPHLRCLPRRRGGGEGARRLSLLDAAGAEGRRGHAARARARAWPALVELFRRHDVLATFLFSVGPDHTGRAVRRVFRRGFSAR